MPRASDAQKMTAAEYLAFEQKAQVKHEFVNGFVFRMPEAGEAHNLIRGNILARVHPATRDNGCRCCFSEMKLALSDNVYYYPDLFVTCDASDLRTDIKTTACFIVEILLDSTVAVDRGEKLHNYRKLSSLQAYILVSQKERVVDIFRRSEGDVWRHEFIEEGELELPCLPLKLSLDEIYEDVL